MPPRSAATKKPRYRGRPRCVNARRYWPTVNRGPGPAPDDTLTSLGDIGLKVRVPAMWHTYTLYGGIMPGFHAQLDAPPKYKKARQDLWPPYLERNRGPRMHWRLHSDAVLADASELREYVAKQIALYKERGGTIRSGRRRYRTYGTLVGFEFEVWHIKSRRALRLFFGHEPGKPTIRLEYEAPIGRTDDSLLKRCWSEVRYLPTELSENRVMHG
jgi:hypothetical protein